MNFVSHQNFCFALLAEMASRCSSDQPPKSVRATLLQPTPEMCASEAQQSFFTSLEPSHYKLCCLVPYPARLTQKSFRNMPELECQNSLLDVTQEMKWCALFSKTFQCISSRNALLSGSLVFMNLNYIRLIPGLVTPVWVDVIIPA